MFRVTSLPIIRSFLLYIRHWYSAWKRSSRTCMKLSSAECTEENSWWCAKKLPETCTVLWQNKFWIISASGWLLEKKKKKKSVTTHGNMNVKLPAVHSSQFLFPSATPYNKIPPSAPYSWTSSARPSSKPK